MYLFSDRHHIRPQQPPPTLPPVSAAAAAALTMATAENNNNQNNESAKFQNFPPFSTAQAMAAMALANSAQNQHHKSAFAPTTGSSHAPHPYFRSFEPPPNFFAKDLFPFPPPLFPPSFFVGFSSNPPHPPPTYHHSPPGLTPFNLTENPNPCLHRPCVDPLCSQCAPKVDSTDESSAKEDCD